MSYHFRPAQKGAAKLLLGVYSESGCGKTYSSLLVARGFVGPSGAVGMIETESGRGEIYIDVIPGGYQVCSISSSFSPKAYGEAITAAEQAKLGALIIDSASHEWESVGGVLSMAADNQAAGKKGPLVWQQPKLEHARHFVLRLMASPIPLVIVNMRAKYPMREVEKNGKKEWARSEQLEPKQSEDILFEMLIHGWIDAQHRYHVTKYPKAIPELREVVRDNEPLSIETGQRLARWAAGAAAPKQQPAGTQSAGQQSQPQGSAGDQPKLITAEQALELESMCSDRGIPIDTFKKNARINKVSELRADRFEGAKAWIMAQKTAEQQH